MFPSKGGFIGVMAEVKEGQDSILTVGAYKEIKEIYDFVITSKTELEDGGTM